MKTIYPNADKEGMCFGVALMGMQALFADDLKTFDKRLLILNNIRLDEFSRKIQTITDKQVKIYQSIKKSLNRSDFLDAKNILHSDEHRELKKILEEKLETVEDAINDLIKQGKMHHSAREAVLNRRLNNLFFHYFFQQAVETETNKTMTEDEKILMDVQAFFEGILIYQDPSEYSDYFGPGKTVVGQNVLCSAPLALSKTLENGEHGKIAQVDCFSGAYTETELIEYFTGFAESMSDAKSPIALILHSSNHTIMVSYNPVNKHFILINANTLPTQYLKTPKEIANEVTLALGSHQKKVAVFSTEIFTTEINSEYAKKIIDEWKQRPTWKKIHTITVEKTKLTDSFNTSWLHISASWGHTDVARALIAHGADTHLETTDSQLKPLLAAVTCNHVDIVAALLETAIDKDEINSALFIATSLNYLDIVHVLLGRGADLNCIKEETSPLYQAVKLGHYEMVNLLLNHGAYPDEPTGQDNAAPLYAAAELGHTDIAQLLLKAGATVDHEHADYFNTAIYKAAQHGHLDFTKLLLAHDAKTNIALPNRASPLYIAAQKGYGSIVLELLTHGAEVNRLTSNKTPLYIAAMNGHMEVVKLLLAGGADAKLATNGVTPLAIAIQCGHASIAELLTVHLYADNPVNIPRSKMNAVISKSSVSMKSPAFFSETSTLKATGLTHHNIFQIKIE